MKIIILGDVHLGKSVSIGKPGSGKDLNSRIKDQFSILYWVLDKTQELGSKHIVITGDVYNDPKPHPTLINLFMKFLKTAEKCGIDVHIVDGNHDILRTGAYIESALDLVPVIEMQNAYVYKNPSTVNFDGISITLIPYRDRRMYEVETTLEALNLLKKELKPEIEKIKPGNLAVCIGHLAIEGSISIGDEIDDELNEIFCPPNMFKDWKYTWMGHVHNPHVLHKDTEDEPYYVAHVGSMERSDFSKYEMMNKKIIVAIDSDGSFEEIELPNRRIHKVDITVPKDNDSNEYVINYLTNFNLTSPLHEAIIKLDIRLHSSLQNIDRSKILSFLYDDLKAHYICYFSESRILDDIVVSDESGIDNSISPEAAIDLFWDNAGLDDDVREQCRAFAKEINKMYLEQEK